MITGHGGDIYALARQLDCAPADIIDMSSNVNPLGPVPGLRQVLARNLNAITALPEAGAETIIAKFAGFYDIDPGCVLAGNGTTQLIYTLPVALNSRKVLIVGPTYSDYADACAMFGVAHTYFRGDASDGFQVDVHKLAATAGAFDTVFICNPNNPTGTILTAAKLIWLCRQAPHTVFVIDESYMPFADEQDAASVLGRGLTNVVVLHSMSKIFRIPGLRIGFIVGPAELIDRFEHYRLPWAVNSLAHVAVNYLMTEFGGVRSFLEQTHTFLAGERKQFLAALADVPHMTALPSVTSFFLVRLGADRDLTAGWIQEYLARQKILIRDCSNFNGLSNKFIRISLKKRACNQKVIAQLKAIAELK